MNTDTVIHAGTQALARACEFMATLSDAQRATLVHEYTFANAARWHAFPQWALERNQARLGLRLGDLSAAQLQALHALLAQTTGSGNNEQYDEIEQHLAADDWIAGHGGGAGYGRGNFYVALLGCERALKSA